MIEGKGCKKKKEKEKERDKRKNCRWAIYEEKLLSHHMTQWLYLRLRGKIIVTPRHYDYVGVITLTKWDHGILLISVSSVYESS